MGRRDPDRVPDDWVWADYWTRYFTDRQRDCSWVAARRDDDEVVGYLNGTDDVRRFERYVPFLIPGIALRVIRARLLRRPAARGVLLGMLRSALTGELSLPPGVAREYPATFHLNLMPEARGLGLGAELAGTFLARIRHAGVPGVHVQPLSVNLPAQRMLRGMGFHLIAGTPMTAFRNVTPEPVIMQTWVMRLQMGSREACLSASLSLPAAPSERPSPSPTPPRPPSPGPTPPTAP